MSKAQLDSFEPGQVKIGPLHELESLNDYTRNGTG